MDMEQQQLKNTLEAVLMAADSPMNISDLSKIFELDVEPPDRGAIRKTLEELQQDYQDRGFELVEVASGFRMQVQEKYADWVNRIFDEKPQRYSRALLETLAIIAYRQPITRSEIEDIRGVAVSSNIVKTLQEREWVRIVGHRDVPGKPSLLATTKEFLDYFNLKKLSELPPLAEIKDFDQMNPDLFEGLDEEVKKAIAEDQQAAAEQKLEATEESTDEESNDVAHIEQAHEIDESDSVQENDSEELEESDNVIPFTG